MINFVPVNLHNLLFPVLFTYEIFFKTFVFLTPLWSALLCLGKPWGRQKEIRSYLRTVVLHHVCENSNQCLCLGINGGIRIPNLVCHWWLSRGECVGFNGHLHMSMLCRSHSISPLISICDTLVHLIEALQSLSAIRLPTHAGLLMFLSLMSMLQVTLNCTISATNASTWILKATI